MKLLILLLPILLLVGCDKTADITPIEYRLEFTGICDAQGDCERAVLVTFESESPAKLQIEGVLPCNVCLTQLGGIEKADYENVNSPKYYDGYFTIPAGVVLNVMVSLDEYNLPTNGDYSYFGDWYSRVQFERGYKWRQVYSNCKD